MIRLKIWAFIALIVWRILLLPNRTFTLTIGGGIGVKK